MCNLCMLAYWISEMSCVIRFCRPIMTKAKPAPPKPSTPEAPTATPPQGAESQQGGAADANTSPNPSENTQGGDVPPASGEPMETDKPEPTAA